MNIEKISTLAAQECVRQKVGLDRVAMLLKAYNEVLDFKHPGTDLTTGICLWLAEIVEPTNGGVLRDTPVVFENGGSSCPPNMVTDAFCRLFNHVGIADVDEWVKQFLWVHPFVDGNGRTAWVLYNWLNGSLDNPVPLPDFFGENS